MMLCDGLLYEIVRERTICTNGSRFPGSCGFCDQSKLWSLQLFIYIKDK